jgi:hypothetical protein
MVLQYYATWFCYGALLQPALRFITNVNERRSWDFHHHILEEHLQLSVISLIQVVIYIQLVVRLIKVVNIS